MIVFDSGFFRYAHALLESIRANFPNHPDLLIFYDGDDADILAYLDTHHSVTLIELPDLYDLVGSLPASPVGNHIVYARLYAFSREFAHYRNIVYLDADSIVLRPFDDLLAGDDTVVTHNFRPSALHLNDRFGVFTESPAESETLRGLLEEDGLPIDMQAIPMVQAGVLKVPRRYRTRHAFDELIGIGIRYRRYLRLADQSVISLWCARNGIEPVHRPRMHLRSRYVEHPEDIEHAQIIHFDKYKPDSPEFERWPSIEAFAPNHAIIHALRELYFQYARCRPTTDRGELRLTARLP